MGRLWAYSLPAVRILGISLNPGPFTIKEHVKRAPVSYLDTLLILVLGIDYHNGWCGCTDRLCRAYFVLPLFRCV